MYAGDLKINDTDENKDVHFTFGDITIKPVRKDIYGSVDASAGIGEVHIPVRGVDKGGFFRSFTENGPSSRYPLKARTSVGDVTLE